MSEKRIKHHGLAHLLLMVVLFLVSVVVFGGWTQGPLTSGLYVGAKVYGLVKGGTSGDLIALDAAAPTVLQLVVVFVVNLAIYYVIAAVLIFLFNLVFGGKEAKK